MVPLILLEGLIFIDMGSFLSSRFLHTTCSLPELLQADGLVPVRHSTRNYWLHRCSRTEYHLYELGSVLVGALDCRCDSVGKRGSRTPQLW